MNDDVVRESEALLSGMIDQQRAKVTQRARDVMPGCSFEDVLNPDGVEPLRDDPVFNYEDGILAGLISAQVALRASVWGPHRRGEPGGSGGKLPEIS
jgi:hypothetical protein